MTVDKSQAKKDSGVWLLFYMELEAFRYTDTGQDHVCRVGGVGRTMR